MIADTVFTEQDKNYVKRRLPEVIEAIKGNLHDIPGSQAPVPIAGACYKGIWMEHNQDWFFLADMFPENAWAAVELFMKFQKENGLFPVGLRLTGEGFYRQVQQIWPFARCAFEIARKLNKGEEDLKRIYRAATAYDKWLDEYRDHKKLGLVDMFCEFDTGHDQSPRGTDGGLPRNVNPDAGTMPDLPILPILAPDLSAMRFQARVALSEIAALLGDDKEALRWREESEKTRAAIRKYLYDPEDDYYYDVDRSGAFRKYRTEHITRLYLNGVVEQDEFDRQYARYFEDPQEFGTAFPFPSISVSDPSFVKDLPKNCWGGNTQALTALRAVMWLPRYGREEEKNRLLKRWLRAIIDNDSPLPQELNPFTGAPIGNGFNYMPTLFIFKEAAALL